MAAKVCHTCELGDLNKGFQHLTTHLKVLGTCQNYLTLASFDFLIFNMEKINIPTLNVRVRMKENQICVLTFNRQVHKLFFPPFFFLSPFLNFFFIPIMAHCLAEAQNKPDSNEGEKRMQVSMVSQ